jgi:hypothetical protein
MTAPYPQTLSFLNNESTSFSFVPFDSAAYPHRAPASNLPVAVWLTGPLQVARLALQYLI